MITSDNVTPLRRHVHGSSFHYKDYLIAKMGYDGAFEEPHGFVLYKQISPLEMRICEIYVEPEKRQLTIGSELADKVKELALAKGCTHLSCSNVLTNPAQDRSAQIAIMKYGFIPVQAHNNEIIYVMEIQ